MAPVKRELNRASAVATVTLAVDPLLSAKASGAATAAKQLGLRSCAEQ